MRKYAVIAILAMVLITLFAAMPVYALKVYANPSTQTGNVSPDGTYNEANTMQVVADKFDAKCAARGFSTRDSNWLSLSGACSDANTWAADCFIAFHTDATGSTWTTAHGTFGEYYQASNGVVSADSKDLCQHIVDQCINQFSLSGRGAMRYGGYVADWSFYGYNLYVLVNTNMTATLIEGLVHNNADDTALMKSATGQNEYAEGAYRGVCDRYGYSYSTTPALDSAFNAQSYTANLTPGQAATVWVEYKNTGTDTWTPDGSNPVRLGTWNPQDRSSVFYTAGNWVNPSRPSNVDTTTGPGAVGRFTFVMTGPTGNYGYHQEYWKLVAESRAWFGYEGVWFGVNANPFDVVVDNSAAGFSASSSWAAYSSATDKYGADYRGRSTAAVSDPATWTVNVPQAGNYDVYAWWTAGANRPASAPYIVTYNGGSATVNVNQQANGGSWQKLGRWNFVAGNNTVKLSCWTTAGYTIIADAVRFVGPY